MQSITDLLRFRIMIAPYIIELLFWAGLAPLAGSIPVQPLIDPSKSLKGSPHRDRNKRDGLWQCCLVRQGVKRSLKTGSTLAVTRAQAMLVFSIAGIA